MGAPLQQAARTPVRVFTYGSLMFAPVWERVVGGRYRSLPARLHDYVRLAVRGASYPGIVEREGAQVDGLLYLDVDPADLDRLDAFEGSEYARRDLVVSLPDGSQNTAAAYVYLLPAKLDEHEWDPARFDCAAFLAGDAWR